MKEFKSIEINEIKYSAFASNTSRKSIFMHRDGDQKHFIEWDEITENFVAVFLAYIV